MQKTWLIILKFRLKEFRFSRMINVLQFMRDATSSNVEFIPIH